MNTTIDNIEKTTAAAHVALKCARSDLPVFPCREKVTVDGSHKVKSPYTRHGFKDATTNIDQISYWWKEHPNALIGMQTGKNSGILVIDLDIREGINGVRNFENFCLENGKDLPLTPYAQTPSGGVHYYFKMPSVDPKIVKGKLAEGIDIKHEGGYIIHPGSKLSDGRSYSWIISPDKVQFAELPDWLLQKLLKQLPSLPVRKSISEFKTEDLVQRIKAALEYIPADDRQVWLGIGMALKAELGNAGSKLWDQWSSRSIKYDQHDQEKTWQSFKGDGVGIGTLFHMAKENGWKPDNIGTDKTDRKGIVSFVSTSYSSVLKNQCIDWPDLIPLPASLKSVQKFDFDMVPEPFSSYVKDISERLQCPPDYVFVAVMESVSAVVGRKIGIRPQENTSWTVVPNLWGMIIGRPGMLKSPAMEAALKPLDRLVDKATRKFEEDSAEYKKIQHINKVKTDEAEKAARKKLRQNLDADIEDLFNQIEDNPPVLKRYVTTDSTVEALGELLIENPNGILVYRDELVSLLKSLDREDNAGAKGFYLTGWNGDSKYTFDRIMRGRNLSIPGVCISILGSTQPGRVSGYMRSAIKQDCKDDGLVQRFGLLVWPDIPKKWENVDRVVDVDLENNVQDIFDWLDNLDPSGIGAQQDLDRDENPTGIPYLRFNKAALVQFVEWRTKLEASLRGENEDLHPALESHFAKFRSLVPSLALLFHLMEQKSGAVEDTTLLRALACAEYLESHAIRAYSSVTAAQSDTAKEILKRIRKDDLRDGFSAREVYRKQWSKLSESATVREALSMLCDYGYLVEQDSANATSRKSMRYAINPKVYQK